MSRIVSSGYSYCRQLLSALIIHSRNGALRAARLMRHITEAIRGWLRKLWKNLSRAFSGGYPYYRHPLPVRIMHWSNVVFLAILLMSGLNIFNAHPALYWGKSSYSGAPPVLEMRGQENDEGEISGVTRIFGHEFNTTGFLGASRDSEGELTERGFPSWLTIPDGAMAFHGAALALLFRLAARDKRHRLCDLLHREQAFAP